MMFSFIIPVYNCKPYLSACVESIRALQGISYEILLIDDGSTDGSGALCDAFAQQYPELRVFHQTNSGASAARNRGIQEANGDRVLFFDADDTVDHRALEAILLDQRCFQTDLTIYGLTFDYYYQGKCYRQDPLYYHYDGILTQGEWGASIWELYTANSLSPLCNKVFSREILLQNGLTLNADMFLYEDFEFVLRYLSCCRTVWNVPKPVYQYRQSEDEGNARRRLARIDSIPRVLAPIEQSLYQLQAANPAIPPKQISDILLFLHLTLAREKTAGMNPSDIHRICREFREWWAQRELPAPEDPFHQRLLSDKALLIYLAHKKTALRHWIAVRVKAFLHR